MREPPWTARPDGLLMTISSLSSCRTLPRSSAANLWTRTGAGLYFTASSASMLVVSEFDPQGCLQGPAGYGFYGNEMALVVGPLSGHESGSGDDSIFRSFKLHLSSALPDHISDLPPGKMLAAMQCSNKLNFSIEYIHHQYQSLQSILKRTFNNLEGSMSDWAAPLMQAWSQ